MTYGLQILTHTGMRDINTFRIPRFISSIALSGGSGSFTLPTGCDASNSTLLGWDGVVSFTITSSQVVWTNPRFNTNPNITVYIFRFE